MIQGGRNRGKGGVWGWGCCWASLAGGWSGTSATEAGLILQGCCLIAPSGSALELRVPHTQYVCRGAPGGEEPIKGEEVWDLVGLDYVQNPHLL